MAGSQGRKTSKLGGNEPASRPRSPRKKSSKERARSGSPPGVPAGSAAGPKDRTGELKDYRITLTPGPDILRRGINPLGVFDELRELGQVTISTDPGVVPSLDLLDPERCYLSWTITVQTSAEPDRLHEVFLFFTEDSTVTIERLAADGQWLPVRADEPAVPVPAEPASVTTSGGFAEVEAPTNGAVEPPPAAGKPAATPHPEPVAIPALSPAPRTAVNGSQPINRVPRPNTRIRVDAGQLDELVGLAGELAVLSDNLMGLREIRGVDTWLHALESLQRVSREIRDTTLDLRMVPVDELFSRFPRVVRDLADRSGKEIDLRIIGQETRLDRTIVERLSDPDGAPDPQRRGPCPGAPGGSGGQGQVAGRTDHALRRPRGRPGGDPRRG